MSLSILAQINEFQINRDKYTEAEKQILKKSFREAIANAAKAEQKKKGLLGEDSLLFI